jgi:3-hydroxypropanoate dehydrogenase
MSSPLSDSALDTLFFKARTHVAWQDKPVADETLRQLYDLMKWGPTSANTSPLRIVFLRTPAAKQRLLPALSPGNVDKTMQAPVTAILAYDLEFYELLPRLFPAAPAMKNVFSGNPELTQVSAMRNGSLQGGYFILAARALGLDCGPMSGFDNAKVDAEFFPPSAGDPPSGEEFIASGHVKSNFLCNLGHGDPAKLHPRGPRLAFAEACQLL